VPRHSTFELYDRLHGGNLGEKLSGWRAEGASLAEIAFRLREIDIPVSTDTVRRWLKDVEAEGEPQAEANA
jgi:transposase